MADRDMHVMIDRVGVAGVLGVGVENAKYWQNSVVGVVHSYMLAGATGGAQICLACNGSRPR